MARENLRFGTGYVCTVPWHPGSQKEGRQIVEKGQEHIPAKINLELSACWPASGVLRLNSKGKLAGQIAECRGRGEGAGTGTGNRKRKRERERDREEEKRNEKDRGETWEQRPD